MCPSPVLPVLPNGRLPPTRLAPASLFRDLHIQKYVIKSAKIGDWSVPSRPSSCLPSCTPSKIQSSCFLIKFHAFMLTSSYTFLLMPSYLHASCLHAHAFMLHAHAFQLILSAHALMPSCSCHHVPTGGSHLTAKIYHWSLHPHDHVHVCQAAPRQKFPFMFPDQISCFHAHIFMLSYSCLHTFMLHVFLLTLSCFMLTPSYSYSELMPSCLHVHAIMFPRGGSHLTDFAAAHPH